MRKSLAVLAASFMLALPANAAIVLNDSFDGENGGASMLNYTGFANFTVASGSVDLIAAGDYGISCSGACIDMDGTMFQGGVLVTKNSYAFNAGDLVKLSITLSGNQRTGSDSFDFGFNTASDTLFNNVIVTNTRVAGDLAVGDLGPGLALSSGKPGDDGLLLSYDAPFAVYSISFIAGNTGLLTAYVANSQGADNIGPVLDNVTLEISPTVTPVPEPATWAMFIGGFGLIGGTLRQRRRAGVSFAGL